SLLTGRDSSSPVLSAVQCVPVVPRADGTHPYVAAGFGRVAAPENLAEIGGLGEYFVRAAVAGADSAGAWPAFRPAVGSAAAVSAVVDSAVGASDSAVVCVAVRPASQPAAVTVAAGPAAVQSAVAGTDSAGAWPAFRPAAQPAAVTVAAEPAAVESAVAGT